MQPSRGFASKIVFSLCALFVLGLISVPTGEAAKKKSLPKKKDVKAETQVKDSATDLPVNIPAARSNANQVVPVSKLPVNITKPPSIPELPAPIPRIPKVPPQVDSIQDVQKQIDDILRLNQTLKARYADQADEVRRITEQAQIHQRILNNLAVQKTPAPVQETPLSAQRLDAFKGEQVKTIGEQTSKDKRYLETLSPSVQTSKPQSQTPQ